MALLRLELRTRTFLVLGAAGDPHLGGEDFDRALAKHLEPTVLPPGADGASCHPWRPSRQAHVDKNLRETGGGGRACAGGSDAALLQAVERAKRQLSEQDTAPLDLPGVGAHTTAVRAPSGESAPCSRANRVGAAHAGG